MDQDAPSDAYIGNRIRALRQAKGLSLDALAEAAGVSRAMIARIEKGQSSATAQLLGRLCGGLEITMSMLFAGAGEPVVPEPLIRRADQRLWRDPGTGYVRRNVSPPAAAGRIDLVDVDLPPGATVAFDRQVLVDVDQLVWVLQGTLEMIIGETVHRLEAGDCLHMTFDRPMAFRNSGQETTRYAVVVVPGQGRRGQ